jgi:hypothetical protein
MKPDSRSVLQGDDSMRAVFPFEMLAPRAATAGHAFYTDSVSRGGAPAKTRAWSICQMTEDFRQVTCAESGCVKDCR